MEYAGLPFIHLTAFTHFTNAPNAIDLQPLGQRVRDKQHADPAFELVYGLGKAFGGVLVQCAGGFIKNQYFGALEQGSGNGDALLLPARKTRAALANLGLISLGQLLDGGVDPSQIGGLADLIKGGSRVAHAQVVQQAAAEQNGFLRYHAKVAAQLVGAQVAHVNAVQLNAAAAGDVKAQQQLGQGALATAAGAHDGNRRAGLQGEVEVLISGPYLKARP